MTGPPWVVVGGVLAALGVAAAAFGAHALADRLTERALDLWEMAGRYLLYGGFALILTGLAQRGDLLKEVSGAGFGPTGWALLAGTLIFTGTLFALALGAPRWLGAITPIGGTLLIVGFLLFAWAAART